MDVFIVSAMGLASLGGLLHLGQTVAREIRSEREIEEAQIFRPDDLIKYLNYASSFPEAKNQSNDNNEYKVKCLVQGVVHCNNPIKSKINSTSNLIHSVYYIEDMYSNNSQFAEYTLQVENKRNAEIRAPLVFQLKDPIRNGTCQIHRSLEVNANNALERIGEKKIDHQLTFFEKVLVYIGMVAQIFSFATKNIIGCRGIKIGWTEKEFGIRVGSLISIFGEVVYNAKDKSIRMDSPLYYLKEKSSVLKELKGKIAQGTLKFTLLAVTFGLSSFYLLLRARAYYQRYQTQRLHDVADRHKQIHSLTLENDYKCIVCAERPRSVILKPCLHFSLCGVCYHKASETCPVCNRKVTEAVEVFFS